MEEYIRCRNTGSTLWVNEDLDYQLLRRCWTQSNSGSVTAGRLPCDPKDWPKRVHLAWFIIGRPPKGYVRWHKNGDKNDFRKENLEWRPFAKVAEWGRQASRSQRKFEQIQVPQASVKP